MNVHAEKRAHVCEVVSANAKPVDCKPTSISTSNAADFYSDDKKPKARNKAAGKSRRAKKDA